MESKKTIYIVLTHTGTILSKIIKYYTRAEFSHVSLSLDETLNEMYSFGRLHAYNPFIGGFVHENIHSGTFKRFKKTKTEIYEISLTDEQYEIIKKAINEIEEQKQNYKFNIIGLFASGFNLKYKQKNSFYCAEFVKYLTDKANLNLDLPELVKPIDFKYLDNMELKYQGKLRNYRIV